jgi:hypothetical protein
MSFVSSADDVFKEIAAAVPRYGEMTFGKLGFKGIQAPYQATSYELLPMPPLPVGEGKCEGSV